MQQKPAYELFGLQCHGLLLGVVAVVLVAAAPTERYAGEWLADSLNRGFVRL
jgi:hypothetical protein